jgi:hypothetical protein
VCLQDGVNDHCSIEEELRQLIVGEPSELLWWWGWCDDWPDGWWDQEGAWSSQDVVEPSHQACRGMNTSSDLTTLWRSRTQARVDNGNWSGSPWSKETPDLLTSHRHHPSRNRWIEGDSSPCHWTNLQTSSEIPAQLLPPLSNWWNLQVSLQQELQWDHRH